MHNKAMPGARSDQSKREVSSVNNGTRMINMMDERTLVGRSQTGRFSTSAL